MFRRLKNLWLLSNYRVTDRDLKLELDTKPKKKPAVVVELDRYNPLEEFKS